jgi:hypothetical protein
MAFRNIEARPSEPVDTWGVEGILAAIDRGGSGQWRQIAVAVRVDPYGEVAKDLEQALALAESPGGAGLLRLVLLRARETPETTVARRIQLLVWQTGWTIAEVAERLGTSRSRLSSYCHGRVTPSAALVVRLAVLARWRRDELL